MQTVSFDRFAVGLPDPQDKPAALVGTCLTCRQPIYLGERAVIDDGDYFCDAECYMKATDARWVIAGTDEPA